MAVTSRIIKRFAADEWGLETVEYAIIAGIIAMATIITVMGIGLTLNAKFGELADKLDSGE